MPKAGYFIVSGDGICGRDGSGSPQQAALLKVCLTKATRELFVRYSRKVLPARTLADSPLSRPQKITVFIIIFCILKKSLHLHLTKLKY